jgi:hypothetical protein
MLPAGIVLNIAEGNERGGRRGGVIGAVWRCTLRRNTDESIRSRKGLPEEI